MPARSAGPIHVAIPAGIPFENEEAAIAGVLSPGDTMIHIEAGKFGQRWGDIGKAFGVTAFIAGAAFCLGPLAGGYMALVMGKPANPSKTTALGCQPATPKAFTPARWKAKKPPPLPGNSGPAPSRRRWPATL